MIKSNKKTTQAGFSMVELLVFMGILSTFFVFLLGVMLSIFRSQSISDSEEELQNEFISITNALTQEFRWGNQAVIVDEGDLDKVSVISSQDGEEYTTNYQVQDGYLLKNGEKMNSVDVIVTRFDVVNLAESQEVPLLVFTFGLESVKSDQNIFDKTFTISLRQKK